jgi:amino acid adenylation domain-containing protein
VHDVLSRSELRSPDRPAVIADGSHVTYRELHRDAAALARWLLAAGVNRGDRVMVFTSNTIPAVVAFWAVVRAGAVVVMINPGTRAEKLAWLLDDCEPAALIADGSLAGAVAAAAPAGLRALVLTGSEPTSAGIAGLPRPTMFDAAVAAGVREDVDPPAPSGRELAALIYTSGSSGEPKAVMVTHDNVDAAAAAISSYLGLREDDVLLCVLPLSFDYGLYQMIMTVRAGARLVLERSFDLPGQVLNAIVREHVTVLPGVPTMFAMLARLGSLQSWDMSSVRMITSTAAALGAEQIAWLRGVFPGAEIFSMYGLTECKRCTYLPPADLERKPGSVGISIPGNEIWLVDAEDRLLGPCEVGELVVRGPTVMAGYWRRPEETARRLRPGPEPGELVLYTGDLCRMDEDGYLYFVARMDDVIKSRGEKVAPAEVEAVLRSLPGVLEAAVVGVPDEILGHAIKAFVVLDHDAEVTPSALRAACRERLEPFMVPRTIEVVDALPRTPNGKVEKAALV